MQKKKKVYGKKKGLKNIIWSILIFKLFLEVIPNGTSQGYFCPIHVATLTNYNYLKIV